MKIQFGETLKKLRTKKGLTQSELAAVLSVTSQSVSRWEYGQSYPDIEQIPIIADYFRVTIDELMGRSGAGAEKLEQELRRIRREEDLGNIQIRRRLCAVLKELAADNPHGYAIAYFREIVFLHRDGFCWESDVEEARELCRQVLETCSKERIPTHLASIMVHEDEDKIGMWQSYITADSNLASWDDILLMRYFAALSTDKWEKQRQTVLWQTVMKAVYTMANDIPLPREKSRRVNSCVMGGLHNAAHYRKVLDLIDLFSEEESDIFLEARLFAEIRLAAALSQEGHGADGLALLDTVRQHLELAAESEGKKLRGSVPQLAFVEKESPASRAYNAACDICMQEGCPEFDPVRDDGRFRAFFEYAESIINLYR